MLGNIQMLFFKPEVKKLKGYEAVIEIKCLNKGKLINITNISTFLKLNMAERPIKVKQAVFQVYSDIPNARKKLFARASTFDHKDQGRLNIDIILSKSDIDREVRNNEREEKIGELLVEIDYVDFMGNEKTMEYKSNFVGKIRFKQLLPQQK